MIDNLLGNSWIKEIFNVLLLFFVIACLLALFDFFSLGLLKRIKKKWFVRVYYPINRFIGIITLSYFYRGLYYTFITNIPRRIAIFALPAYLLIALFLLNAGFYESKLYMDDSAASRMGQTAAKSTFYRENFSEKTIVQEPFISKYYVEENYLPVYIPITEQLEDILIDHCDSIVALNDRGFHWLKYIKLGSLRKKLPEGFDHEHNANRIISCLQHNVGLLVNDSAYQVEPFRFYEIQNPVKKTFMTTLDLRGLNIGNHSVQVVFKDSIELGSYTIAFYKTP